MRDKKEGVAIILLRLKEWGGIDSKPEKALKPDWMSDLGSVNLGALFLDCFSYSGSTANTCQTLW